MSWWRLVIPLSGVVACGSGSGEGLDSGAVDPRTLLVVNEIMASNGGSWDPGDGTSPDWVELYNGSDEDLDLGGLLVSDDYTWRDRHTLPSGVELAAGGHLLLRATGAEAPEEDELPFKLSASGEGVGLFLPDGDPLDWVLFPPLAQDVALGRVPDGESWWAEMPWGTPGSANRWLEWSEVEVLAAGATWRLAGEGAAPDEGWTEPGFDDGAWSEASLPVGHGDDRVLTEVSTEVQAIQLRREITLEAVPDRLLLGLMVDDGVRAWLDGVEVVRSNLPPGEVDHETAAVEDIDGPDERRFVEFDLPVEDLSAGTHTLALEVHQVLGSTEDLFVDVELIAGTLVERD